MKLKNSKRIMIIGSGGSGKSTLARKLSAIIKLPVIHLDTEFWNDNWVETPKEKWDLEVSEFVKRDTWIIDGNYGRTMDIRIERADTIIFLDVNNWVCLFSAIKRWLTHLGKTRPDMAPGCKEKIDLEFIKWIYNFPRNGRIDILKRLNICKDKNCMIFKSRKEVKEFLKNFD